jgi:hypothetical protein
MHECVCRRTLKFILCFTLSKLENKIIGAEQTLHFSCYIEKLLCIGICVRVEDSLVFMLFQSEKGSGPSFFLCGKVRSCCYKRKFIILWAELFVQDF